MMHPALHAVEGRGLQHLCVMAAARHHLHGAPGLCILELERTILRRSREYVAPGTGSNPKAWT
jgi:hypothetical protein